MSTLFKLLVGVILLVVPLGMYAYEFMNNMQISIGPVTLTLLKSLGILLQGSIPPFLMLIGLFMIWLELDEMKIEKELKKEEEKEKEVKKTNKKSTKKSKKK